ncbi:tRNA sulfurtransferase [uncultured archaeon]|nr:tRNA sulfurtransferase [uncultured archaeon]
MRSAFRAAGVKFNFSVTRHRIIVKTLQAEDAASALSKVFGVVSVSPALTLPADSSSWGPLAAEFAKSSMKPNFSFAVRAHRLHKKGPNTPQIERTVGSAIQVATGARVNLTAPDVVFYLEVYSDAAYLFTEKRGGVGGLPYGTQGKVACLLSDSDDVLAAWALMRRGCVVCFVHPGSWESAEQLLGLILPWFPSKPQVYVFSGEIPAEAGVDWLSGEQFKAGLLSGLARRRKISAVAAGYGLRHLTYLPVIRGGIQSPVLTPLLGADEETLRRWSAYLGFSGGQCKSAPLTPQHGVKEPFDAAHLADLLTLA